MRSKRKKIYKIKSTIQNLMPNAIILRWSFDDQPNFVICFCFVLNKNRAVFLIVFPHGFYESQLNIMFIPLKWTETLHEMFCVLFMKLLYFPQEKLFKKPRLKLTLKMKFNFLFWMMNWNCLKFPISKFYW